MAEFNFEHVNFRPWDGDKEGDNYFKNNHLGYKLLVLGESHYCANDIDTCKQCIRANMNKRCFSMTEQVMDEYLHHYGGQRYLRSFVCFERAVFGQEIDEKERLKFWNSVVFYNYFQNAQPKSRHELRQNEDSTEAFREVLKTYMPDFIVVWGVRLFNNLPCWDGTEITKVEVDDKFAPVKIYNINGKRIPAMQVYHPSAPFGKKRKYWHAFYRNFLPETTWDIVSQ